MKTEPTDEAPKWSQPSRNTYILAAGLLILAGAHGVAPKRLLLDWPMVALLAMAVALCLVPFSTLLGLIEKLKYGEFEVLLRDLTKLNAAVQVVANVSAESESQAAFESSKSPTEKASEHDKDSSSDHSLPLVPPIDPKSFRARTMKVMAVQIASPTAALVQLSIDMEEAVVTLFERYGGREVRRGMTILSALDFLERKNVVEFGLAEAIREFWRVRNRIVHSPTTGPVPDHIVAGAIDNGIVLLREVLLRS